MPLVNNSQLIQAQYANAEKLDIRIALHQKYSLNKEPFGDWILSHYELKPGMRVLELGCGTGNMWHDAPQWLPEDASLILTDFSEGMLDVAKGNVPPLPNISFRQVDIQQIPYEDNAFDVVIANMMLYHVPDLDKALSEVARVLKPDGRFFCATVGEQGVAFWLAKTLGHQDGNAYPFSLQNGKVSLSRYFGQVECRNREDGLRVTDVEDLTDYVLSMASFSGLKDWPREKLTALLSRQAEEGVIAIPKEYGLFICTQPKATR
ncbi:MAG: class I SAM-dependent methyltransferase [Clostridiales bacterium]|nr:class I SAM-dependent methyltransferase [Clostridiales bacterium]